MKNNKLLPLIFTIVLLSCNKNADEKLSIQPTLKRDKEMSYKESLARWNELKNENGNSYVYEIMFISWTGLSSITELKIEKGSVISRAYKEIEANEANGEQKTTEIYSETRTNLGSHEKGASPLTIDDLYNSCAREYLTADTDNNTLYFETDPSGLMTLCGFVPNGCMDDCFVGVEINSFKWIN